MHTTKASLAYLLFSAVTALLVSACGGSSSSDSPSPTLNLPNTPSAPLASANSSSQISISWSDSDNTDYQLYSDNQSDASERKLISSSTSSPYQHHNLSQNSTYYYWLKACNNDGCSDFSTAASATTHLAAPPTPQFSAFPVSFSTIRVTWSDYANQASNYAISSYSLHRSSSSDFANASTLASLTSLSDSYDDSNVSSNTNYYYWLQASNASGNSRSTPAVSAAIAIPATPATPTASAAGSDAIELHWQNAANAAYYVVRRSSDSQFSNASTLTSLTQTSFNDSNLATDSTYTYWVKACNLLDCSSLSAAVALRLLSAPGNLNVALSSSDNRHIDINWSSKTAASHYQLYYSSSKDDASQPQQLLYSSHTLQYAHNQLNLNTSYTYWVKACNADGCSDFSTAASAKTPLPVPSMPSNLSFALISASETRLSWSPIAADYEVDYLEIYRSSTDTLSDNDRIAQPNASDGNRYYDSALSRGSTYHYAVKACNIQGCSDFSTVALFVANPPVLNDTGITFAGNYPSGTNADCSSNINSPQDCNVGRDAEALAGTLSKIGAGEAGFDFSKLDSSGNPLAIQNVAWSSNGSESAGSQWACVRDNLTGLIWEVKTDVGDSSNTANIHHKDNTYQWGDNNWQSLVDGSNAGNGLCGFSDWRVPTADELASILLIGSNPSIDTHYFANTVSYQYWTSTAYASGFARVVYFDDSDFVYETRGNLYRVRLVRSSY